MVPTEDATGVELQVQPYSLLLHDCLLARMQSHEILDLLSVSVALSSRQFLVLSAKFNDSGHRLIAEAYVFSLSPLLGTFSQFSSFPSSGVPGVG